MAARRRPAAAAAAASSQELSSELNQRFLTSGAKRKGVSSDEQKADGIKKYFKPGAGPLHTDEQPKPKRRKVEPEADPYKNVFDMKTSSVKRLGFYFLLRSVGGKEAVTNFQKSYGSYWRKSGLCWMPQLKWDPTSACYPALELFQMMCAGRCRILHTDAFMSRLLQMPTVRQALSQPSPVLGGATALECMLEHAPEVQSNELPGYAAAYPKIPNRGKEIELGYWAAVAHLVDWNRIATLMWGTHEQFTENYPDAIPRNHRDEIATHDFSSIWGRFPDESKLPNLVAQLCPPEIFGKFALDLLKRDPYGGKARIVLLKQVFGRAGPDGRGLGIDFSKEPCPIAKAEKENKDERDQFRPRNRQEMSDFADACGERMAEAMVWNMFLCRNRASETLTEHLSGVEPLCALIRSYNA
jgi:hypothetical protein